MKLTNMLFVGSLVFVLGACSTPTPATSTPETEVKKVVTSGKYEVTNNTGADINGLYIYDATSSDKGTNYAEGGLADVTSGATPFTKPE